jgi:hypothetical protein
VGPTSIVITLKRTGLRDVIIRDNEKYQLALPPDPLLLENSVIVQGRVAGEIWASRTARTKVELEVRYFMPPLNSVVTVSFGSAAQKGSDVTFKSSGPADDIRLASTKLVFFTPAGIAEGQYKLIISYSANNKAESSEAFFEFVDMSNPRVDSVSQTEGRASGGAVVLIGVTGYCKGVSLLCTPSFEDGVVFEMAAGSTEPATILGAVSLTSWESNDEKAAALKGYCPGARNSASSSCPSSFENFLNGLGASFRGKVSSAVSSLRASVLANAADGVTKAENSFLIAIITPNVATPGVATIKVSSKSGNSNSYSSFTFTDTPSGGAIVSSFAPPDGSANKKAKLEIIMTNFLPIYRSSEAIVRFGAEVLPSEDIKIEFSSLASTKISVLYNFKTSQAPIEQNVSVIPGILTPGGSAMNVSTHCLNVTNTLRRCASVPLTLTASVSVSIACM